MASSRVSAVVLIVTAHLTLLSSTSINVPMHPPLRQGSKHPRHCGDSGGGDVLSSPEPRTKLRALGLQEIPSPEKSSEESVPSSPSRDADEYVLPFGKHAGSPLRKCPGHYVSWMVKAGVYKGRDDLARALVAGGWIQDAEQRGDGNTNHAKAGGELGGGGGGGGRKGNELKAAEDKEHARDMGKVSESARVDGELSVLDASFEAFPHPEDDGLEHKHVSFSMGEDPAKVARLFGCEPQREDEQKGEWQGKEGDIQGYDDSKKDGGIPSPTHVCDAATTSGEKGGVDCGRLGQRLTRAPSPASSEADQAEFVYRTPSPCKRDAGRETACVDDTVHEVLKSSSIRAVDEQLDAEIPMGRVQFKEGCEEGGGKCSRAGNDDGGTTDGTGFKTSGGGEGICVEEEKAGFGRAVEAPSTSMKADCSEKQVKTVNDSGAGGQMQAGDKDEGDIDEDGNKVLTRTCITKFFHRSLPLQGSTGKYWQDPSRPVSTPSPHRTAAAFRLRKEMSWIQSTMPEGLSDYGALVQRFVRPLPSSAAKYRERVTKELELIYTFGYEACFLHVLDILNKAQGMPYLIRGSAAGSLVCYLLGISHIDPVRERMCLSRFMNSLRNDLPDVDLDFPHKMRDDIFHRIFQDNPSCAARISNHIFYRRRSAKREAARMMMVRCRVSRAQSPSELLDDGIQMEVYRNITNGLEGKLRGYSLHCGGVVVLNRPIREGEWLHHPPEFAGKFPQHQVKWDKRDCQKLRMIKIDVLANRGLSHLWGINSRQVYEYPSEDEKTASLLAAVDTIGITFLDSPAMKKALRLLKPKCRRDLAVALAIVRPAARESRKRLALLEDHDKEPDLLIFDDDAVAFLQKMLHCDEAEAERLRKGFAKGNAAVIEEVRVRLGSSGVTDEATDEAIRLLSSSKLYGFCKSHAMSYAHLSWALAYEKAHNLKSFWEQFIDKVLPDGMNVYESWVYKREAILAGVPIGNVGQTCIGGVPLDLCNQMKVQGFWQGPDFLPACYLREMGGGRCEFAGLYATGRLFNRTITFVTCGIGHKRYLDISYQGSGNWEPPAGCYVQGTGKLQQAMGSTFVQADTLKITPVC